MAETKTTVAIKAKDIILVIRVDVGTDVADNIMPEAAILVEETGQPRYAKNSHVHV